MKVLLLKDVRKVGKKGDIVEVKEGFFYNFLARQKLGVIASASMEKQAQKMQQQAMRQAERSKEQALELKKQVEGISIEMTQKANGEKLYGAVKSEDIAKAISEKTKADVEGKNIELKQPIKTIGKHEITVALSKDVTANMIVNIAGK